jgi:hypothetical protein
MIRNRIFVGFLWVAAAVLSGRECVTFAAEPPKQNPPPRTTLVKFRPPVLANTKGAPSVRVTGGSRGAGNTALTLDILAPDQVGETTQEQPSLFWYQSRAATAKFELTVVQENKVKPLVHHVVDRPMNAGVQRLNLADQDAKLEPGIEYQWVVALITDPENRSTDLIASGVIKRVAPSAELKEKISKSSPEAIPAIYGEAGIWYDALTALSDQIEAKPNDMELRRVRADLLQQVGLNAAAQYEATVLSSSDAGKK